MTSHNYCVIQNVACAIVISMDNLYKHSSKELLPQEVHQRYGPDAVHRTVYQEPGIRDVKHPVTTGFYSVFVVCSYSTTPHH